MNVILEYEEISWQTVAVGSQNNAHLTQNFNQMLSWAKFLPPTYLMPMWEGKVGLNKNKFNKI